MGGTCSAETCTFNRFVSDLGTNNVVGPNGSPYTVDELEAARRAFLAGRPAAGPHVAGDSDFSWFVGQTTGDTLLTKAIANILAHPDAFGPELVAKATEINTPFTSSKACAAGLDAQANWADQRYQELMGKPLRPATDPRLALCPQ